MITGIGTDIVEVARFIPWVTKPKYQRSLFTAQEITDCVIPNTPAQYVAERFAARFAAKEAFYKALTSTLFTLTITPTQSFSIIFTAQCASVCTGPFGMPMLQVTWQSLYEKIGQPLPPLNVHLSIAHEKTQALAFVVISLQS
jgi:phosphopantetheine--protein transferase-like protein